jgi:hypothetical protein
MMPSYPYNIYRESLTSLYHGHALWEPDPAQRYQQVSVGDVGYVKAGYFCRMFNVLLEWNDPSNRECEPEPYPRLDLGPFINIRKTSFSKGDYYSRYVTAIQGTTYSVAATSDKFVTSLSQSAAIDAFFLSSPGTTYQCKRQGALLTLPHDGLREDVIRTVVFEDYIRDHVDSWFSFAQRRGLGVERIEDLILVTGCTLVTSWGAAAFLDSALGAEVSLKTQILNDGRARFDWSEIRPSVAFHNSQQDPVREPSLASPHLLMPLHIERVVYFGINAYSSGAFEQSGASSYGPGLRVQQDPFLKIPITTERMR